MSPSITKNYFLKNCEKVIKPVEVPQLDCHVSCTRHQQLSGVVKSNILQEKLNNQ